MGGVGTFIQILGMRFEREIRSLQAIIKIVRILTNSISAGFQMLNNIY